MRTLLYTKFGRAVAGLLLVVGFVAQSSLAFAEVFDPPTISNPNLFTSRSSVPDVDQSTGAFTQRFPLDIPPGRNGLTPDLALVYNSQQLDDGIVGYGWSLSIPYIERFNRTGIERLYTDSYFSSSLGGELATTSTSEYQHRFEDGRFIKYTFSNNSWIAYDKKGTKYTFGASTTAQLYATTTSSNVYRWMLEEIRDSNDNYITYFYTRDSATNQIYPSRIVYTGNNTTNGIFTIDFTRATRTDPITSYKSGFLLRTTDRISEIKASVSGSWVRKYALSYTTGQNGARSLLASVQLTGRDDLGTELAMPATAFAYSSTTPGYTAHTNGKTWGATRAVADSDGNGLPDLNILYYDGQEIPADHEALITKNEFPTLTTIEVNPPDVYWAQPAAGGPPGDYAFFERGTRLFDADGDGKADFVRGFQASDFPEARAFYRNQGGYSWVESALATSTIPSFGYASNDFDPDYYSTGLLGNVNGDGLIDYVVSLPFIDGNMPSNGTYLHLGTSTASWAISGDFSPIAELPSSGTSQAASELVDINGDGLDDWMSAGSGSITFCLNTGTSWGSCSSPWNIATSSRGINGWDRGIRFIDINGDGLPDYVRSYSISYDNKYSGSLDIEKGSYNYVYLNTGFGWATSTLQVPATIVSAENIPSGSRGGRIVYNELVDWNGDGILDTNALTSTTTKPDLLNRITLPTSGTKEVGYTFSSQQASLNPNLAFPMLLVASTTNNDGFGARETTQYTYEGGKMYVAGDVRDRRFSGFEKITKQDGLGITNTYYHQGDTASTTGGELTDGFALLGKPYREDVLSSSSNTLKKMFYHWDSVNIGSVATTTAGNSHSLDLEVNSTQYASISDASQTGLDFSDAVTLSAWVNYESMPAGDNNVLTKRVGVGNQRSYHFMTNGTNLIFISYTDGSTVACNVSVTWNKSSRCRCSHWNRSASLPAGRH